MHDGIYIYKWREIFRQWALAETIFKVEAMQCEQTIPKTKLNSVALVRTGTIPTERPQPVGEVSANFCG